MAYTLEMFPDIEVSLQELSNVTEGGAITVCAYVELGMIDIEVVLGLSVLPATAQGQ